jgi:hypothetical protein
MAVSRKCRAETPDSIFEACRGSKVDVDHPSVRVWASKRRVDLTERLRERAGGAEPPTTGRRARAVSEPVVTAPAPEPEPPKVESPKAKTKVRKAETPKVEPAAPPPAQDKRRRLVEVPNRGDGHTPDEAQELLDAVARKLRVSVDEIARMDLRQVVERWGTQHEVKDWLMALRTLEDIRAKQIENETKQGLVIKRELVQAHVFGHIEAVNKRLLQDAPSKLANEIFSLCRTGASLEEAEKLIRDTIGSYLSPLKTQTARAIRAA